MWQESRRSGVMRYREENLYDIAKNKGWLNNVMKASREVCVEIHQEGSFLWAIFQVADEYKWI